MKQAGEAATSGISRPRKLLFAAAIAVLSFLAVELASFVFLSVAAGKPFVFSDHDAFRSYVLREDAAQLPPEMTIPLASPNGEVIHPYLGFVVDPTRRPGFSEQGFRGETTPFTPDAGAGFVVGIFGGSFAEGVWAEAREALASELGRSPSLRGREIVIHPVALGGYKQPQQLLALSYFLALGARFDAVVEIDGFNEVALHPAENAERVYPFYPRGWPARVNNFIDDRRLELVARLGSLDAEQRRLAALFSRFPLDWSVTANLIWRSLQVRVAAGRAKAARELEEHMARGKERMAYIASGPRFEEEGGDGSFEALAGVWKRSSREMRHLAEGAGARYFHFLQPNQYVEGSKILTGQERREAWREDHPYREGVVAGYPLLIAGGAELKAGGVGFHDLTGIFRSHAETLYEDDCCHVSREGYEIVAREIAKTIAASLQSSPAN